MKKILFNIEDFNKLKSVEINYKKTAYIGEVLQFIFDDSIYDNVICKFTHVNDFMKFYISNLCINKSFINKYNIKAHHIELINRLCFCEDYCAISIYEKKPYGNSDYMGDIEYVYRNNNNLFSDESSEYFLNIHKEVLYILEKIITELDLGSLEFEHKYLNIFKPTQYGVQLYNNYKRTEKLKRILYD